MTVDEIIDYVRNIHNESNAQTKFWSDDELYSLIEVKSNQINTMVPGLIQGSDTSTTTVASTAEYTIPTGFIEVHRVWYDGRPLKYVGFRPFESRRPTGVATSGLPREFMIWNDQIILSPPPSEAKTLTFWGTKIQATITSGATTPSIPVVFHSCLCDGVVAEMYAKDENLAFANTYEQRLVQLYIPAMKEYVKRHRRRGMPSVVVDTDSALETEFGVI